MNWNVAVEGRCLQRRLKETAVNFTCIEEILEQVRRRKDYDPLQRFDRTTWLYDYQIVVDRERLTENRLLLRRTVKNSPRHYRPTGIILRESVFILYAGHHPGFDRQSDFCIQLRKG
jgi:hypothetical protein